MARLFRAKASRAEYRRAGLLLGSAAWSEPFDLAEIGADRMATLAGDPVVILAVKRDGDDKGDWELISAIARAEFSAASLQVVDPDPVAGAGPSWADVEAVRQEADALQQELAASRARIGELEGEVSIERAAARAAEKAADAATKKVEGLGKQVEALKAGLTAAKAKSGKAAPADENGPVDPPAGDQAT